ncbi:hypothetical protein [Gloeobacter morelensis]|uniref:Uncharacterized protein n=1 Tax=Gloeobacter morelensis MG652769 TaxID=2781736 RepID=A0ABY3PKA4_9CYAN|nr:hypothetical protein [Gloeobacter morelensis]UFP94014.1 hypothetical protein ISF26_19965 [Gloeobacter morelensis MG652769]
MRLVRVQCDAQGAMTIAWYPFDRAGKADFANPLQAPYPLPRVGLVPTMAATLDLVVDDDYTQVYTLLVPEGGLPPWVFHHLYQALWEHILVLKHFLPPEPGPEDIERMDALTASVQA